MDSKFFKGLLAAVIAALATIYSVEGASIIFYGVSIAGTVLVYFAQNALLKSITVFGTIDLKDIIKGSILAVGTAVSSYAASLLTGVDFTWSSFGTIVWSALVLYISKNLFSNSSGTVGTETSK